MKNNELTNGIFIANLEGVDVINHIERERGFANDYKGVLPYSLEMMKLATLNKFETHKYYNSEKGIYDRLVTDDVINLKFSCGQMDKTETKFYILKQTIKRIFKIKKITDAGILKKQIELEKLLNKKNPTESELEMINDYKAWKKINKQIEEDEKHEYNKRTAEEIRDYLYKNGFTITKQFYPVLTKDDARYNEEIANALKKQIKELNKTNDEEKIKELKEGIEIFYKSLEIDYKETKYKMWKRSSSKSRTGQVLFIKESLLDNMNEWGRMGLNFPTEEIIDVVGLSAYSSLVSSHIEDVVTIKPSNILIVRDVLSIFKKDANVIKKDEETGHLKSFRELATIESSLFDGESLLDEQYFKDGQSFMLLRQHFFKSASFNTKLVEWLKNYYGDKYDTAEIKDMFGNRIRVNQIHMIITPNSLKALKFSKYVEGGTDNDMYKFWKNKVKEDKNIFGVCKHDKPSKQGHKIQQMSYQMINSLRANKVNILELAKWEIEYINNAKNDIEVYKDLLKREANHCNSNEMMIDLMDTEFRNTSMFRKYRAKAINKYVDKIKGGKIKITGDNCTIIQNPVMLLKHAVGELKGELNKKGELILSDDITDDTLPISEDYIACSTKLFDADEMLVEFRNPHTSSSNCGLMKNFYSKEINDWFNFGENIVAVNTIKAEFQDINSGSDADSDFILISNDSCLVSIVKKSFRKDLVCINDIPSQTNEYKLTNEDMAKMDSKLSESKDVIGEVVNLGQLAMSTYYDEYNNENKNTKKLKELEDIVNICTILSGCAIDNAKRTYSIEMNSFKEKIKDENGKEIVVKVVGEIENIRNKGLLTKKPSFWKYVSEKANNTISMSCPMEYLSEILNDNTIIKKAKDDTANDIEFINIIKDIKGKGKNYDKILNYTKQIDDAIAKFNTKKSKDKDIKREQYIDLENIYEGIIKEVKKLKVNEKTMQMLLKNYLCVENTKEDNEEKYTIRLMNVLYNNNKKVFLNLFHKIDKN